jgi:protein-tyrosine sulfotransferase
VPLRVAVSQLEHQIATAHRAMTPGLQLPRRGCGCSWKIKTRERASTRRRHLHLHGAHHMPDETRSPGGHGFELRGADPIFIHGILPRSGTNFLWDLLLLHPDLARGREPVNEDLFLDQSDHLMSFVEAVRTMWDPRWGTFGADLPERLQAGLGEGLVSFLWTDRDRRLVTKSPSVRHLDRFFAFFPGARLLILVRDGRSVAQSAMETFGWDFDRAGRAWSEAADTIRRFQQAEAARADRWRVVRYEDLVDDPEGELRAIFHFLELEPASYDFDAARNLPVRGSSAFGRRNGAVHWATVAKNEGFAPKERWRSWSAGQLERFDWLTAGQLAHFGYSASPRQFSGPETLSHRLRDWRWHAARTARQLLFRARVRAKLRTRLANTLKRLGVSPAAR